MGRIRPAMARTVAVVVAGILGAGALPALEAHAAPDDVATLHSTSLDVTVSTTFPQVMGYTWTGGAHLDGQPNPLTAVRINGKEEAASVAAKVADDAASIDYELTFAELEGVTIDAKIAVDGDQVSFNVTGIEDPSKVVSTIEIPDHNLVSVDSKDSAPKVATAKLSVDRGVSGDDFLDVTATTPTSAKPSYYAYAIVSANGLAAALETNAMDYTGANGDNARWARRAALDGDAVRVGISSASWLYRAKDNPTAEELPWAKVVVTPDANADGVVDWQDGAIAMRSIAIEPKDADKTADRVIAHIPFNFASQATHPFLRTLDDIKRISLATDGLGQFALLKGYQSEGHDSAHPDYAGNYNTRAGGLKDLNTLLDAGEGFNATFGVHINTTEAYAEANAFSEDLVKGGGKGWDWLGQSYYMDQYGDLTTGRLAQRLADLASETHDNLSALYVDVYYQHGWRAESLQRIARENGFAITTEWAEKLEHSSLWSHWAADEKYGGTTNKGINSQIVRFVRNHEKDVWNPHPLLDNAQIIEFEGWTNQTDWNAFYRNIWTKNLPAKYLQQTPIVKWSPTEIRFEGGVVATGTALANRVVKEDGHTVIDSGRYLIPWFDTSAEGTAARLYHYNQSAGTTTWELTDEFAKADTLKLFKLTTDGRQFVRDLPVTDGTVAIEADANTPYVLYPTTAPALADAAWGEGSPVKDPGFNASDMASWTKTGDVTRQTLTDGHQVAVLGAGESSLSQTLAPLRAGTYSASVWVEIGPGATRPVTLSVGGGEVDQVRHTVSTTTAENWVAADEKHTGGGGERRYYQRLRVLFEVPAQGGAPELRITAADGTARVALDDVRVVATKEKPATTLVSEDFENVDQGWGPFVKGNAGGSTDPRTHLAAKHAPFTQQGWRDKVVSDVITGERSLKSHKENQGLVYRTWPGTANLVAGHAYKVEFDYQSEGTGYRWVTGYDAIVDGKVKSGQLSAIDFAQQTRTTHFSQDIVAGCGETWVGLEAKGTQGDFVMDDFTITDLGESDKPLACGTLRLTSGQSVVKQAMPNTFTTSVQLNEAADVKDLAVTLEVPEGWDAQATTAATAATLAGTGTLTTTWSVVPDAEADGSYPITAKATYTTADAAGGSRTLTSTIQQPTYPKAPTVDTYASDMVFVSEDNGWGPVERDLSNGEQDLGDGTPLRIGSKTYEKGLGTHAPASIEFYLGKNCQSFRAEVGIDEIQGSKGSVAFKVMAGSRVLATSPNLTGNDQPFELIADVTGQDLVTLVVDELGNNGNDHADWGDAKFTCGSSAPSDLAVSATLSPVPDEQADGWNSDPTQVFISAQGDAAAGATIEYSVDKGPWSAYTKALTFAQDGVFAIDYRATKGESVATGSTTVKVDMTAPVTEVTLSPVDGKGTSASPVTMMLNPTDAGSGVGVTMVRVNNEAPRPVTDVAKPVVFDQVGTYTVQVWSVDKVRNSEVARTYTITITEPATPTVSAVLEPAQPAGAGGWYTQAPTMTVSTADFPAGSEPVIEYALTPDQWVTYTEPVVLPQGVLTVALRATAGEQVATGSLAVKVDTEAPALSVTTDPADGKGTPDRPVTISAAASDTTSQVASVQYRVGSGDWASWAGDLIVDQLGTHTVTVRATDTAGNVSEEKSVTVTITPAPAPLVVAIAVDEVAGESGWYTQAPTITLTTSGSAAAEAVVEYSLDGATFMPYAGPFQVSAEGEVTINAKASAADESATAELRVKVDRTPPRTEASLTAISATAPDGAKQVTLRAADAISQVASLAYQVDGGEWRSVAGSSATVDVTAPGMHTVSYRATDNAGNVEATGTVKVPVAEPGKDDPTASLSASEVKPGGTVTITGAGFAPGEEVVVTLHSAAIELARVTADKDGKVSVTVKLPTVAEGSHSITLTGVTSQATAAAALSIRSAAPSPSASPGTGATPSPSATSRIAATGSGAMPFLLFGVLLIGVGGAVALVAYRRRQVTSS